MQSLQNSSESQNGVRLTKAKFVRICPIISKLRADVSLSFSFGSLSRCLMFKNTGVATYQIITQLKMCYSRFALVLVSMLVSQSCKCKLVIRKHYSFKSKESSQCGTHSIFEVTIWYMGNPHPYHKYYHWKCVRSRLSGSHLVVRTPCRTQASHFTLNVTCPPVRSKLGISNDRIDVLSTWISSTFM